MENLGMQLALKSIENKYETQIINNLKPNIIWKSRDWENLQYYK
jgi:hypothetical protein